MRALQKGLLIKNTIRHLNSADINLGVSKLVLESLNSYTTYSPKKEYVLYNGVDTKKFFFKKVQRDSVFTIGCIANFWKIKGHILLIKSVLSILIRLMVRLRLIGSGPCLNECQDYVIKNNLSVYIFFEQEIAHEKLNDFYNEIDLFVLPSSYEALGCVYLEAWATRTPFLAIERQGISELVPENEKNNLLAVKGSISSLADKILHEFDRRRSLDFNSKYDIRNTMKDFINTCLN